MPARAYLATLLLTGLAARPAIADYGLTPLGTRGGSASQAWGINDAIRSSASPTS